MQKIHLNPTQHYWAQTNPIVWFDGQTVCEDCNGRPGLPIPNSDIPACVIDAIVEASCR